MPSFKRKEVLQAGKGALTQKNIVINRGKIFDEMEWKKLFSDVKLFCNTYQ